MKLQQELNLVSTLILILLSAAIVLVGIIMMTQIVYDLNKRLLHLGIDNVVQKIEAAYNDLNKADPDSVPELRKLTQDEVVENLRHYTFGGSGHLYILTTKKITVLHRNLESGDPVFFYFVDDMIARGQGFTEYTYQGRSRYCAFETFEPWDWLIALSVSKDEMFVYRELFIRIVTIVTLAILLLSITIFLAYSQRITRNIQMTLDCLKEVEDGNLSVKITPDTETEEIVSLQVGINSMINKIRERTSELLRSNEEKLRIERLLLQEEIQHKEAEINVLQSQINPHFLYNTLECMNSIGSLHEIDEIQEMSISLSNLFKYAIRGGKFATLEDELKSVEDYLKIQHIRFLDRFTVSFELPPELSRIRMLKFLLQPIVENSIFHGLEPKVGKGNLRIAGRIENDIIEFSIEDDGVGMEQDHLNFLIQGLRSSGITRTAMEKRSIGLFNIQNRIRLVYGAQYGIDIDSRRNEGTTVKIRFPVL